MERTSVITFFPLWTVFEVLVSPYQHKAVNTPGDMYETPESTGRAGCLCRGPVTWMAVLRSVKSPRATRRYCIQSHQPKSRRLNGTVNSLLNSFYFSHFSLVFNVIMHFLYQTVSK